MMDNPNVTLSKAPKLRRRSTSLPGPLSKIRHSVLQKRYTTTGTSAISVSPTSAPLQHLQHSKTNPYVGWFRHAPALSLPISVDALWLRDVLLDAASSSTTIWQHQSKRRRVALNSHCSLKPLNTEQASTLLYIKLMGEHCETKMFHQDRLLLHKRRGHLRGGGTEDEKPVQDQDMMTLDQFFYDQCPSVSNNESITIKAFSRIACWLLDVPLPDERLKSKESRDDMSVIAGSVLSEDEDRSEYSYDIHDTTVGSRLRSNRCDTEGGITLEEADHLGLSSQAEAYYALSAVFRHILVVESSLVGEMTLGRSEIDIESHVDRLDYDITQMDIVRMNRIASRHLDVESIVRLPILTYSKSALKGKKSVTVTHPPPMVDDGDVRSIHSEEKHDAEFSWMMVPPSPNAESFDNFSVESCQGSIVSKTAEEQPHSPQGDCDSCVICLEPFCLGDRLRLLPCQHSFHVGCIDRWLSGSHSFDDCYTAGCPTCKARPVIIPPSDDVSVDFGNRMYQSDGSVPSWAFARIGNILARDSQHF